MTTEHWHLDKRVPIAMIFAIIIQTGGAFWWAANISNRVEQLEDDREATKTAIKELTEVKVHLQYMQKSLESIERTLTQDIEWLPPKIK